MTGVRHDEGDASLATDQTLPTALAWIVVGIPAVWGIWQVVLKSLALFRR